MTRLIKDLLGSLGYPEDYDVAPVNLFKPINKLVYENSLLVHQLRLHTGPFDLDGLVEKDHHQNSDNDGQQNVLDPPAKFLDKAWRSRIEATLRLLTFKILWFLRHTNGSTSRGISNSTKILITYFHPALNPDERWCPFFGLAVPLHSALRQNSHRKGRVLIASHDQEESSILKDHLTGKRPNAVVVIPAYNEESSIGLVVGRIPKDWVEEIIVVDNGSSDATAHVAAINGARVVVESRRGYGSACLAGISQLPAETELVVFMDGDYSDYPDEIQKLIAAQSKHQADLVVGSRVLGECEPGSLTVQQRFGNWLSTWLIKLLYGHSYTDLGPFRLIRREALERLKMRDRSFGWTVEMQVKALQKGLKVLEVPVSYRKRIGKSKVSGTLSGSVKAGLKILWVIATLAFQNPANEGR